MESYSPYCKHCIGITRNVIGETVAFCEEWDLWRNVSPGECFNNCDGQETIDGTEPWKWSESQED